MIYLVVVTGMTGTLPSCRAYNFAIPTPDVDTSQPPQQLAAATTRYALNQNFQSNLFPLFKLRNIGQEDNMYLERHYNDKAYLGVVSTVWTTMKFMLLKCWRMFGYPRVRDTTGGTLRWTLGDTERRRRRRRYTPTARGTQWHQCTFKAMTTQM